MVRHKVGNSVSSCTLYFSIKFLFAIQFNEALNVQTHLLFMQIGLIIDCN